MLNYLIVQDFSGQAVPFLFPVKVAHEEMREQLPYGAIISGGTVSLGPNGFICGGQIPALGLNSRPVKDAELIGAFLKN